jgi:hypothetical protein
LKWRVWVITMAVPNWSVATTLAPRIEPLGYLPSNTALGVYNRGPNWLCAALALHAYPAQLYQFDARLGWVAPPNLVIDPTSPSPLLTAHPLDHSIHIRLELALSELVPRVPPYSLIR